MRVTKSWDKRKTYFLLLFSTMNNHNLFYEDNYDIDNFLASRFSNYSF